MSSPRHSDPTGSRPSRSAPRSPRRCSPGTRQVGDLAAQVFRTELFQHGGLAIWNGNWYGGHYTLTYSVLFPPLAALLGPQRGRRRSRWSPPPTSSTASSATAGATRRAGRRSGSPPAWSPCSPTASSPSPSASPSASPRCAPCSAAAGRARPAPRRLRALQPGRRRLPRRRLARRRRLRSRGAPPPTAPRDLGRLRRPRPGPRPQPRLPRAPASSPSPSPPSSRSRSGAGRRSTSPAACASEERQLRRVAARLPARRRPSIWLVPERDGRQRGPPRRPLRRPGPGGRRAGAPAAGRRSGSSPLFMAGGLYWQLTASVSQIARSVGDPSTSAAYFAPGRRAGCATTAARGVRVEVPPTANHWESAYLAPEFELARGWLRQLDTTRDDIFYDDDGLTASRLPGLAARRTRSATWPFPTRPLDYSSVAERRLILARPPYLTCAGARRTGASTRFATRSRWSARCGAAAARVLWVGRQGFAPRRHPAGRLPRPRQLHPLLVDRPRRRLPAAPRRLDPGPRRAPRRLPRRRRLLPCAGLERRHRRPQDLLTAERSEGQQKRLFEQASRMRARNSAPSAP